MAVTEFALLKLKDSFDELEFIESLSKCLELQDEWVRQHQPHLLDGRTGGNFSVITIQRSNPPVLLINAPWDSPQGHHEWIQSEENQRGFGKVMEFMPEGSDAVLLFHMEPVGGQKLPRDFYTEGGTNVCRIEVEASQKEALQQEYQKVEAQLRSAGHTRVWAGWRIEKPDDKDNLVLFCDSSIQDESLERMISSQGPVHRLSVKPLA